MSLLHQVIRMARITFDPKNISLSAQNYRQLKELVDKLSADDINISPRIISGGTLADIGPDGETAPCAYVSLLEHRDVSISIFILGTNEELPLHDHPHMYGLLKAITGNLRIQGFTAINDEQLPICVPKPDRKSYINVRPETPVTISSDSDAVELNPTEGNFHQISAVNGPAAFLDILSPPYATDIPVHGARPCTYYCKINSEKGLCLQRTECPDSFYSINVPYSLT